MKNKSLIKILSVFASAALLTGAFSVTAGAAESDGQLAAAIPSQEPDDPSLPVRYSSVEEGYVTEIKRQGFNDCWAYSTLAAFETKLLKSGYNVGNMSEPHLNLWAMTRKDGTGWLRQRTSSGLVYTGSGYLASWQGGVLESDAGSITITSDSKGDEAAPDLARFGVTSLRYLSGESRNVIKRAILDNGGALAAYSHNTPYSKDNLTYYLPPSYTGSVNGHMIEVVGWDDNFSKSRFSTAPQNDGAWLVKNSWGNNNSEGGYIWISYEDKYLFGADKFVPVYAIEDFEEITERKKLIQNEIYGAICDFNYINENNVTFLNRFTFDDSFYVLDKVIFETRKKNTGYTIYFVPDEGSAPTADTSRWRELYRGVSDYAGYICADLDNIEISGSGSIAVQLNCEDGVSSIGVDEWLTVGGSYFFLNNSDYGMSYVYRGGVMQDVMQWYKDEENDSIGGTFVIKALTISPEAGDVNLDGHVNISDATLIQFYLAELSDLSANQKTLADVNGDGELDISDATELQFRIASE